MPDINSGIKDVVDAVGKDGKVILGVGGYGDDTSHQRILDGFTESSKDPAKFAETLKREVGALGDQLGRPVNGIELDWEYVTAPEADVLANDVTAIDALMPDAEIDLAVPNGHDDEGFAAAMPAIAEHVDVIHLMTYDEHTPYDGEGSVTGPVSSADWMVAGYKAMKQKLQNAKAKTELAIGFPAYCYGFNTTNTAGKGEPYNGGSQTPFNQVDVAQLKSQPDGSSASTVAGVWETCFTPDNARNVIKVLADDGGLRTFAWSAEGLNDDYVRALTGK